MNLLYKLFLLFSSTGAVTLGLLVPEKAFSMEDRHLQDVAEYATCGDCWCIVQEGEDCLEPIPETDWTDLIPSLKNLTWNNPITLDCDPYNDQDCDTDPRLEIYGGACIVKYENVTEEENNSQTSSCPTAYTVETYSGTVEEAMNDGLVVTHEGPCATCSSLQDLAVYMEQGANLTDESTACGFQAIISEKRGIECFEDLGMTEGCARTWYYNTVQTRESCGLLCTAFVFSGEPSNGPPPECTLAECLQCDEDNAGPIFQEFAGRTRRNSYLRSTIARPCSVYVPINHTDPCSTGTAMPTEGMPSAMPSMMPSPSSPTTTSPVVSPTTTSPMTTSPVTTSPTTLSPTITTSQADRRGLSSAFLLSVAIAAVRSFCF